MGSGTQEACHSCPAPQTRVPKRAWPCGAQLSSVGFSCSVTSWLLPAREVGRAALTPFHNSPFHELTPSSLGRFQILTSQLSRAGPYEGAEVTETRLTLSLSGRWGRHSDSAGPEQGGLAGAQKLEAGPGR